MAQAQAKKRVPIPNKADDGPSWIAIIVTAVLQLYPITAILGFLKFRAMWNKKRLVTYRSYLGVVGSRAQISLNKLSSAMGQPRDAVVRVLGEMIGKGYLGPDAYIDYSVGYLVLDPTERFEADADAEPVREAEPHSARRPQDIDIDLSGLKDIIGEIATDIREGVAAGFSEASKTSHRQRAHARSARKRAEANIPYAPSASYAEPEPAAPSREEPKAAESEREATVRKLKALNDQILDADVSAKIDRIAQLTDDIYEFIDQNPERAGQVRKFMNYYLPTTVKLLTSYSMLERQSYQGENIVASRRNIEDILKTLVHAFEKQLDQLFAAEAIDISSDIQVLETMIAKDGLTQQVMQLRL